MYGFPDRPSLSRAERREQRRGAKGTPARHAETAEDLHAFGIDLDILGVGGRVTYGPGHQIPGGPEMDHVSDDHLGDVADLLHADRATVKAEEQQAAQQE